MSPVNEAGYPRRFYVGSRDIAANTSKHSHLKATSAEAVKEAEVQCEATGEVQIVVEIIAVVRPKETPIETVYLGRSPRKTLPRKVTRRRSR